MRERRKTFWNAFRTLNPGITGAIPKAQCASATDTACISDVAVALFNLRNPNDERLRDSGAARGHPSFGADRGRLNGNPLVRQRNVVPAEFQQDQFTFKLDGQLTGNQRLSGTFFYADFPGFDPFPDPSSLASPFTLERADRSDLCRIPQLGARRRQQGQRDSRRVFYLGNSRQLDDSFDSLTNASVGVPNPATFFDDSIATQRLGHYIGRPGTNMERFSFGGPNDLYNKRRQRTWTIGDTLTWAAGTHALRMGGEFRRNEYDTNLPEEQATEFEKFDTFTQLLRGLGSEGDTQFGVTSKRFRFNDFSLFLADDWHVSPTFTLNAGVRYEFFGWPTELDGRIGNVDFEAITNTENPSPRVHCSEQREEHGL